MRRNCWLTRSLLVVALAVAGAGAARAEEGGRHRGAVKLLTTVPVPSGNHLVVFDISWVDPATQLYYLADRSDKAVDVVDAKRNVFVRQIKANFKASPEATTPPAPTVSWSPGTGCSSPTPTA